MVSYELARFLRKVTSIKLGYGRQCDHRNPEPEPEDVNTCPCAYRWPTAYPFNKLNRNRHVVFLCNDKHSMQSTRNYSFPRGRMGTQWLISSHFCSVRFPFIIFLSGFNPIRFAKTMVRWISSQTWKYFQSTHTKKIFSNKKSLT